MIELHGKKYQRIGGVWHFYYPLKNGVEWHELLNWCIKRELKAAEQSMRLTAFGVGTQARIPLQASMFADDQPATFGGR